jgi:hypothetical protein
MVAMCLADAGHCVTLLEKERGAHHKVCGEFLSCEAVKYLHRVGIAPCDLGAAAIRFVRLSSRQGVVEATLPFPAFSLSRSVLDEAMLASAAEKSCEVRRGVFVEKLTTHDKMWLVELRDNKPLCAKTVFLANGKHDLHGWNRARCEQCDLIGFKLHWQLAPNQTEALRDFIELFSFPRRIWRALASGTGHGESLSGGATLSVAQYWPMGQAARFDTLRKSTYSGVPAGSITFVEAAIGYFFHPVWIPCGTVSWPMVRGRSGGSDPLFYWRWCVDRIAQRRSCRTNVRSWQKR